MTLNTFEKTKAEFKNDVKNRNWFLSLQLDLLPKSSCLSCFRHYPNGDMQYAHTYLTYKS